MRGTPVLLVDFKLAAEQEIEQPDRHDEADNRRRRVDHDEVPNERPAAEPVVMLGGSPMKVAVPPMLEAMMPARRKNGRGQVKQTTDRDRHGADEQDRRHVVEQGREHRGQADEETPSLARVTLRKART